MLVKLFLFTPLIPVFTPVRGLITTIDRKLLVNLSKKVKYCSSAESLPLCRGSRVAFFSISFKPFEFLAK